MSDAKVEVINEAEGVVPVKDERLVEIKNPPRQLESIVMCDRGSWGQEQYKAALESVFEIRNYSRWILGMLLYEVRQRWPEVTYEVLSEELTDGQYKPGTLKIMALTYRRYYEIDPNYVPPAHYPYSIVSMVAQRKNIKDPIKMMEEIEDDGVRTVKGAYKKVREKETGKKLPTLPKLRFRWNKDGSRVLPEFKVSDPDVLEYIDWGYLSQQYADLVGERLDQTLAKNKFD